MIIVQTSSQSQKVKVLLPHTLSLAPPTLILNNI